MQKLRSILFGIAIMLVAIQLSGLHAQDTVAREIRTIPDLTGKTSVGFDLSAAHFLWSESDNSMIAPWGGIELAYMFNESMAGELYAGLGWDRPRDITRSGFSSFIYARPGTPYLTHVVPILINMKFFLSPGQPVNPYAILGSGVIVWEARNTSTDQIVSGTNGNLTFNIGFGSEFFFNDEMSFDLSFRYHQMVNQTKDMTGLGDVNTGNIEARTGINWYFGGKAADADNDGVPDDKDLCPQKPEDQDGFEDNDGCPDLDNDKDGIPDSNDECPNQAEDVDEYQDQDGCPDPDNDGDGIPDTKDQCPNDPEDIDGFEDQDGCPDLDNDGDSIPDSVDNCIGQAEDMDGYQDEDGCPDLDNDGDGIPDTRDQCPDKPETDNGYEDEDGCPDEKPDQTLNIRKEKPVILDGVHFEFDSARLKPNSATILDYVAETLQNHPDMEVRISGHTDNIGSDSYNKWLSERRAVSVKQYLVEQGIKRARIETVGYGEERPIADNSSPDGREKNRRIEIIRIDDGDSSTEDDQANASS
ncbi:MAG: OmpA family protein [Candidatus Marinimicrobia bacterium]|nr:OmpA family protein [Candidatus Neomarinimicrobiota bacterium]MCF7880472.1 OmpA family protein [Candidatus Neomarinimicrobiota bacterium]